MGFLSNAQTLYPLEGIPMTLPTDPKQRKAIPLYSFLTGYFPDAIVEMVKVAVAGNEQHNPGEPLHWARGKSTDQLNTAMRHIFDHGSGIRYDVDGTMHLAKAAWRLLAEIQLICERKAELAKPISTGAKLPDINEAIDKVIQT
jgi:hypothetical protein